MKKVLIAVDDIRSSKSVLSTYYNSVQRPETIVLLHVERLQGKSMMIDMLGEAEIKTLRESIQDTEHKIELDRKAKKILDYYREALEEGGTATVKTVIRDGMPADEIVKVAAEEGVDLIILGYNGKKGFNRLISGSVVKDVMKKTGIPVLMATRTTMCEEPYSWRDAYAAVSVVTVLMLALFLVSVMVEHGIF